MSSQSATFCSIVPDLELLEPRVLFFLQRIGEKWVPVVNCQGSLRVNDQIDGRLCSETVCTEKFADSLRHGPRLVAVDGNVEQLQNFLPTLPVTDKGNVDISHLLIYPDDDSHGSTLQLLSDEPQLSTKALSVHLVFQEVNGKAVFGGHEVTPEFLSDESGLLQQIDDYMTDDVSVFCYSCSETTSTIQSPNNDTACDQNDPTGSPPVPIGLPPVLMALEQEPLTFVCGNSAVPVTRSVLTLSPQSGSLSSARISISSGFEPGDDELIFLPTEDAGNNTGLLSAVFDSDNGVLELTGNSSSNVYAQALKQVYFHKRSRTCGQHEREIEMVLFECGVRSNTATRTVTVYPARVSAANDDSGVRTKQDAFSESLMAIEELKETTLSEGSDPVFTIIEPAAGFDVQRLGSPVFSFSRSDVANGHIKLVHEGGVVSTGNIYLEVDSGSDGVFGVVVAVGQSER